MNVDYNKYAKTFSSSRKKMKWAEIEYFFTFLEGLKDIKVLDVGCGSGRLLRELRDTDLDISSYLGIDLSIGLLKEARKIHVNSDFLEMNMLDLEKIDKEFNTVFFVASFHHLNNLDDRLRMLKRLNKKLKTGDLVFFTNWSLESDINKDRYKNSKIDGSENDYGSSDFNIKIGKFVRYYHCFSLKELEFLFKEAGFEVIENREFENKRNIVSIIKKIGD